MHQLGIAAHATRLLPRTLNTRCCYCCYSCPVCVVCCVLQNPTQDAVIDPVRGVTKKEGHSPHHKVQMRTSEQVREGFCTLLAAFALAMHTTAQCASCFRSLSSAAAAS